MIMTKEAFIVSVNKLYAVRHTMAKNAKRIIEDMLREKGNMDSEYLYGETEDPDWVWVGDNEHLVSLQWREDEVVVVELENDYGRRRMVNLSWLVLDDHIEIAYYLCRM